MKEKIKKIFKAITLDKLIKVSILLAILVVTFSLLWYFVIDPYQNRKGLDKCLDIAKEKATEKWKQYCVEEGRKIGTDGSCLLDSAHADYVNKGHKESREDCFKKYPVK